MAENENPTLTEKQEERTEYLTQIRTVASALRRASAVMVLSGAGMSVDSGLKTYTDIAGKDSAGSFISRCSCLQREGLGVQRSL